MVEVRAFGPMDDQEAFLAMQRFDLAELRRVYQDAPAADEREAARHAR